MSGANQWLLTCAGRQGQVKSQLRRQKELERIDSEREDLLRRQTQDLEALFNELDEASSKLDRLTLQTAPLAAERAALTLAAYQSGRDKLAAVLEARKLQLEIGLRALELQGKKLGLQWRLNSIIAEGAP